MPAAMLAASVLLLLGGCGTTAGSPPTTSAATGSLVVSTSSVLFGTVQIGQTATAPVTVTNNGTASLQISSIQITGQDFSLAGNVTAPLTLASGSHTSLTVQFDPTQAGAETGVVTLATGGSAGTATISLSGTGQDSSSGTTGAGTLSSLSCSSGSMSSAGSDACTVTLTAPAGTSGLTVNLSSSSSDVTVPATVTVAAGATTASFTAAVSAVTSAETVVLTASAGGVTETYSLNLGAAVPALTLNSTTVGFGDVELNTSATQSVTLTSSGSVPLVLSTGAVAGTGFSISGITFPLTLNPNATATLNIQFDPTASGAVTGGVTLTDNTSAGTATIQLSGTGEATVYEVNLTWDAPGSSPDPVASYSIYRARAASSSYQLLGSVTAPTTAYTDTSTANGTTYNYYVVSVDSQGNQSTPSNIYTVAIP